MADTQENQMLWVDINTIQPNAYNPKDTEANKDKYEVIKAGIAEMGMNSPLDVREIETPVPYEILDGYHRWLACKELGWTKIPISSWGKISDQQAQKITILKEKAKIPLDLIKTSKILNELAKDTALETLARQVGYNLPDLTEDLKLASFSWDNYNKDKQGEGQNEGVRTLSVAMTKSQYDVVQQAIAKAKGDGQTESEARALELIAADYLAG